MDRAAIGSSVPARPIISDISIVTPWHGHPELIADYEAVVAGAEVIVVDNGSAPEDAAQIRSMVDRVGGVYLPNHTNLGFAAANNQGLATARGDIVVFLNSDVAANGADFLNTIRRDVPPGALAGPELKQQLVYGVYLPYLDGWCIAGHRADWNRIGGWDAAAYPGPYWEDCDLSFRALEAGLELKRVKCPFGTREAVQRKN